MSWVRPKSRVERITHEFEFFDHDYFSRKDVDTAEVQIYLSGHGDADGMETDEKLPYYYSDMFNDIYE